MSEARKMNRSRGSTPTPQPVRLNKYLAECGIASRRKADSLIEEGKVTINGKKVYELGMRVDPRNDKVTVEGKPVRPTTNKVYIMFHKPKNVVTTMEDPMGRPTIAEFFERLPVRVFPVGRLDWDTEGLILLTNDGDFSQRVSHPMEEVPKTYLAKVSGHPSDEHLQRLIKGVTIIGGKAQAIAVERIKRGSEQYDWIKIIVAEGKNRMIRRMFEKLGFDVLKLQRVAIGKLRMGSLKRGEYVFLTEKGVEKIFERYVEPDKQERSNKASGAPKRQGKSRGRTQGAGSQRSRRTTAADHRR